MLEVSMLPWLKSPLSDSGKINLLVEKLAEVIGSGHKVVIFSQFVMLLDRVRAALVQNFPDLPRYELTGMTLDRLPNLLHVCLRSRLSSRSFEFRLQSIFRRDFMAGGIDVVNVEGTIGCQEEAAGRGAGELVHIL